MDKGDSKNNNGDGEDEHKRIKKAIKNLFTGCLFENPPGFITTEPVLAFDLEEWK